MTDTSNSKTHDEAHDQDIKDTSSAHEDAGKEVSEEREEMSTMLLTAIPREDESSDDIEASVSVGQTEEFSDNSSSEDRSPEDDSSLKTLQMPAFRVPNPDLSKGASLGHTQDAKVSESKTLPIRTLRDPIEIFAVSRNVPADVLLQHPRSTSLVWSSRSVFLEVNENTSSELNVEEAFEEFEIPSEHIVDLDESTLHEEKSAADALQADTGSLGSKGLDSPPPSPSVEESAQKSHSTSEGLEQVEIKEDVSMQEPSAETPPKSPATVPGKVLENAGEILEPEEKQAEEKQSEEKLKDPETALPKPPPIPVKSPDLVPKASVSAPPPIPAKSSQPLRSVPVPVPPPVPKSPPTPSQAPPALKPAAQAKSAKSAAPPAQRPPVQTSKKEKKGGMSGLVQELLDESEAKVKAKSRPKAAKQPAESAWYETIFNDEYFRTLPMGFHRQTQRETQHVLKMLGVSKKAKMLDLCCGFGRHTLEMARRGYDMSGLDLSLSLLRKALNEAQKRKLSIRFIHGDMRKLGFQEEFDAIFNVHTSFGYFDDQTNFNILLGIVRALKPGGRFLLEVANRDYIIQQMPTRVWWRGPECLFLDEVSFLSKTSTLYNKRSFVYEDGRPPLEQNIRIRLFSAHELLAMLRMARLKVLSVSGDWACPGYYLGSQSERLIVVAEKPKSKA